MNSLLWLTSAATPLPEITVDPTSVTPGPWGFGAIVILTIAVVLGHRRRSRRRSDDVGAEETPSTPDEHDDDRARTGRTPPA